MNVEIPYLSLLELLTCQDKVFRLPNVKMTQVKYPISYEYFDDFLEWLMEQTLNDRSDVIETNEIYNCLRDNGFIDNYLFLQFDYEKSLPRLYVEIMFSFRERFSQTINELKSDMEKLKKINLLKKRVLGIKFIKQFSFEGNIRKDDERYEDFEFLLDDIESYLNVFLDILDKNRTPKYISEIPYTDPEIIRKNTEIAHSSQDSN